jgi:DNA-binding transcriptional ArsR family regulator
MKTRPPIDPAVLRACASRLRALSHPERLRIVEALAGGAKPVGELAVWLQRPQATTSQHLMRLRALGLVAAERVGRVVRYRIVHRGCLSLLDCIRAHFAA